jgi:Ni,Fe-hydrogenase I small subunit
MRITRRQFIKYVSTAGAALGLSQTQVFKLTEAVAKVGGGPKILWLQGQPCNGCSVATVQLFHDVTPQDVDSLTGADIGAGTAGTIIDAYGQAVEDYLDGTGGLGWSNNGSGPTADIADVLLDVIDLEFHQTLMSAAGYLATDHLMSFATGAPNSYVLAIEGSIPSSSDPDVVGADSCRIGTDSSEVAWTMEAAVDALAPNAAAVICVGQCASFGNWPAARNQKYEEHEKRGITDKYRYSGAMSVPDWLGANGYGSKPYVRVSGCPLRAEEMYLTVALALIAINASNLSLLTSTFDSYNRPKSILGIELYNKPIHNRCINKNDFLYGRFATQWGQNAASTTNGGCLAKLGCKGPSSWRSCQRRVGTNVVGTWEALNSVTGASSSTLFPGTSCITAGANCYACGEQGYPDRFSHPLTYYTGYTRGY